MGVGEVPNEGDGLLEPGAQPPEGQAAVEAAPGTFDRQLDSVLASGAVEEAPGDPKELIATPQAPGTGGPAPENIVGAPDYGPPAPQPATDAILAKLPPPGAPGTATGPSGPTNPDGSPATPVTPEGVNQKQTDLEKGKAEDALLAADDTRKAALAHQQELHDALDHGNGLVAQRQKVYDDALAKYQAMKPQDYFENHSKFVAAIGLALGAFGAGLSAAGGGSGENHALTQLNRRMDDDYKHQIGQIERARDTVLMAHSGLNDAKEAKAALIEDATAKWVAQKAAAENEVRFQLAERGVPAAEIESDKRVLQLGQARRQAEIEAEARQKREGMDAARQKLIEAQTARQLAAAAKDDRWKAKGSGGGGGGGGGASGGNAAVLAALQKSGGELTPEVADVAKANGVKTKDLNALANQAKGERRIDLRERGEVTNDVKEWVKDNDYLAKSKKATELDKLGRVLSGDNVSGLDKAFVLQEAEKAAKGGTATVGGVNIDMAHMAGGGDKLNQIIAKWKNGDFSGAQTQSLIASIRNQAEAAKQEVATAHDDFQQTFRDNPRYASDPKLADEVNKSADRLFGIHGYSRKSKAEAGAATKGAPATPSGNPALAQAQAWLADPKNAASPLRGAVQAKVDALKGAGP